jgi:hypothetical protein
MTQPSVFSCANGHQSSDSDFCSVCGSKIVGDAPVMPMTSIADVANATPALAQPHCPDCGTPYQAASDSFCEVCGYNFKTGASGALLPTMATQAAITATGSNTVWRITVQIDPMSATNAPTVRQLGPQDPPQLLLGRRSERRAIFPDLDLASDDAVSHRHALLLREPSGVLRLRDLDSANGCQINAQAVVALHDSELFDGDVVTLGHHSHLEIKKVI